MSLPRLSLIHRSIVAGFAIGACVFLTGGSVVDAAVQATFYVSPAGSDSNNGSSPAFSFATLTRARDAVRLINSAMTGDINVLVMKGDYFISKPIEFSEKDSGTSGFTVIYKCNDANGSARFIGGSRVKGWTVGADHIARATIDRGLDFTTLYENGIRADLARWPKRSSPFATSRAGYLTRVDGPGVPFIDSAPSPDGTPFAPAGKDFSNALVYTWDGGDHRWSSETKPIKAVENGSVIFKNGGIGGTPNSFIIEGSLGLLSRPGEYFYDKATGVLSFYSRFRPPIEQQEVIFPRTLRILSIAGSSPQARVQHLQFQGLDFQGTDRSLQGGTSDWKDSNPASWEAAIYATNAQNLTFKNCRVTDTGGVGIQFDAGTESCTITGCLVEHTGYHGISLKNGDGHTISNCLVRYCGELRGHGSGIWVTNGIHTLEHLEIYYVARSGIAIRSKKNVIRYAKLHDCVQDSGDQGAFYLVDPEDHTKASENSFTQCTSFHNYVDLSCMDRPPTAIYNDRDSPNTTWTNIDAGDSQMYIYRHDPQPKDSVFTFDNVNWKMNFQPGRNESTNEPNPAFNKSKMEYSKIGVTPDFPVEYNDLAAIPAAPINFWAQTGNRQVTLHWMQVDHATSYTIKRSTSARGPSVEVGKSAVPATGPDQGTSFLDPGVTNGVTYLYTVSASNQAGIGPDSLELAVKPALNGSNKLSGTPIGAGGNPAVAVDGNLKTYFESANGWAGLDLHNAYVITSLRYSPRSDNTDTTARMCNGEFQGSNDPQFTQAVPLFKVRGTKGGVLTPVLIPVSVFNTTPFRYVRFIGNKGKTLFAEMEFYGYAAGAR